MEDEIKLLLLGPEDENHLPSIFGCSLSSILVEFSWLVNLWSFSCRFTWSWRTQGMIFWSIKWQRMAGTFYRKWDFFLEKYGLIWVHISVTHKYLKRLTILDTPFQIIGHFSFFIHSFCYALWYMLYISRYKV